MNSIEEKVRAIVIPSGNLKLNRDRMETAIRVNEKRGLNVPYILSGVGRDINAVLYVAEANHGLEFHKDMWDYMMQNTEGIIGVDMLSVDSIGNVLNTFPPEISGKYIMVSYPLHIKRFKRIVEQAKKDGKVSSDLEIEYIPTKTPPEQIVYEAARVVLGPLRKTIKRLLKK